MQESAPREKGVTQKVWEFLTDFFYIYIKFALYAVAIYILFYYYDYYFG